MDTAARGSRRWGLVAVLAAVAAATTLMQPPSAGSAAHYALVRALSTGTTAIDRTQHGIL